MGDDRMGLTIPDLENGSLLQLSGRATVQHLLNSEDDAARVYPGALRLIRFSIEKVNHVLEGSLPIQFSEAAVERQFEIKHIVQETPDVKSFYLTPKDGQPMDSFLAGRHLPIRIRTSTTRELLRTYSLSSNTEVRISVKRQGKASSILHGLKVGDTIFAQPPVG